MKKSSKSKLLKKFESYISTPPLLTHLPPTSLKLKPFIKEISDILIPESKTEKLSQLERFSLNAQKTEEEKKRWSRQGGGKSDSTLSSLHNESEAIKSPSRSTQEKLKEGRVFHVKPLKKSSLSIFRQSISTCIDDYFAGTSLGSIFATVHQGLDLSFSLEKHRNSINGIALVGSKVWTVSADYEVRTWEIPYIGKETYKPSKPYKSCKSTKGKNILEFKRVGKHKRTVTSIDSTKSFIMTGSQEGIGKLWSESGLLIRSASFSPGLSSLFFLNSDKVITAGSRIEFWDIEKFDFFRSGVEETGKVLKKHKNHTFFSGDEEGMVKFWDVRTPRPISAVSMHFDCVSGIALNNEFQVLTCGLDAQIKEFDLRKNDCFRTVKFSCGFKGIEKYGNLVFTAGEQVNFWDYRELDRVSGSARVSAKVIRVLGDFLFTGGYDGVVNSWEINLK